MDMQADIYVLCAGVLEEIHLNAVGLDELLGNKSMLRT
jgi:hypothetical protein